MKIDLAPADMSDFDPEVPAIKRGLALGFTDPEEGALSVHEVLATLDKCPRPAPWGSYWALCGEKDAYVGICGFKASPDRSATVEIAYYTFPACEGRGVATQMARGLTELARSRGIDAVVAHTLAQFTASVAVLQHLGFAKGGTVHDPEDGEIWAWRLDLSE